MTGTGWLLLLVGAVLAAFGVAFAAAWRDAPAARPACPRVVHVVPVERDGERGIRLHCTREEQGIFIGPRGELECRCSAAAQVEGDDL